MHPRPTLLAGALAALTALLVHPGASVADDEPVFTIGGQPAWFLLGGIGGGGTVAVDERGGYVGGEISLVRLNRTRFIGLYGDGHYDWSIGGTYASAGLEIGTRLERFQAVPISVGLDGGVAMRFADSTDVGAAGRAYVTLFGTFSLYGRYAYFDAEANRHVVHVGAILKFPLISPFGSGAR